MKFVRFPLFLILLSLSLPVFAQKLKPEEIIAKHLDSIGTAEARAAAKSRMIVGDVLITFISQKNQTAQGRAVMASEANKMLIGMNLNAADYTQEKFTYDGKNSKVAFAYLTQRSLLGNWVDSNSVMLGHGLMGGALSTAWAPLNMGEGKGKLSGGGTKKIDGKEVYAVGFSTKGSDVDITLFFEKDTFRHVRTEYKRMSSAGIGRTPNESSGFSETRYKMVEDFSDFKDEKGLMMPHVYKILYSVTGQRGTTEVEWALTMTAFTSNPKLDANTFDQ